MASGSDMASQKATLQRIISLYMELLLITQDEHDQISNDDLSFLNDKTGVSDNFVKKMQIMGEIDEIMDVEKPIFGSTERKEIEMLIKGIMDINKTNIERIEYHQKRLLNELSLLKSEKKAQKAYIQMG
jgi:hypothetical protein